jgi:predicted dehydrogenase
MMPNVNLTPEQKEEGRRSFLRAVSQPTALSAVRQATALAAPFGQKPVRIGFIGPGQQGRVLLGRADPAYAEFVAMADINPTQLKAADKTLETAGRPPAKHYVEWREMLEKEDIEAVILAVPLWMHAPIAVAALEAGKHVLCEKMMAWDDAGCAAMTAAAEKSGKVLEIGYQRYYNPSYVAAYEGVVRQGLLGDVFHARLVWHRNQSWRRKGEPPSPDYNPSKWGYPTFDHLLNWRLHWQYSKGLFAELGSHQVNVVNWFFGGVSPERVFGNGGVLRFKEGGREVFDHVYATWDYPGGRTATFSSIESNAMEGTYEAFFGTKGTLIMSGEREAFLFEEKNTGSPATTAAPEKPLPAPPEPDLEATTQAIAWSDPPKETGRKRVTSSQLQISTFCAAVRRKGEVACGPVKAMRSAQACIRANEAAQKTVPLAV